MTTEGLKGDQKTRLNSENFFQITQSNFKVIRIRYSKRSDKLLNDVCSSIRQSRLNNFVTE